MIQRCLLRKSLPKSTSVHVPHKALYRALNNPSPLRFPSRQPITPRYYSIATEATSDSQSSTAEKAVPESKDGDPLEKELETKNREIIDLKVRDRSPQFGTGESFH